MKKLLTVLFAILIICAFGVTAFASNGEAESENVFEIAFDWASANSAEILSALTFLGSLVLAFTYKKGLLPKLSGALSKIGGSVSTLTEETDKSIKALGERFEAVRKKSEETEKLCATMAEGITSLSDKLAALSESADEKDKFKLIMSSQIDMLYEIFMQSSLPQYAKDSVGEKISAMKMAVSGGDTRDE